jgi:hypothetical protein
LRLAVVLVASLFCSVCTAAQAGAIVAGKDFQLGSLQAEDVRRIFLGREYSINGVDVLPVYQKVGLAPRAEFDGKMLDKPSSDLAGYWSKLIFTGRATSQPKEVSSDREVKTFVNGTPGAIGYISDDAIDDSVKVLLKY